MNIGSVALEKFSNFEWLMFGITAKAANYEPSVHGTGEKPLDYQDRLGAIASMDSQLAKSVTSVVVFDGKCKEDYEIVRKHLADIMIKNATQDKKRQPEQIKIEHLAYLIARMVIDFALDPDLEDNYTAKGRLHYAGINSMQMTAENYRKTWKPYENLMTLAIESAIDEADKAIEKYKKNTYKEMRA